MTKEALSLKEFQFLILLGLPALASSVAYSLVTIYLPIFIERLSGAAVTGFMIGGEGFFAIVVPFFIGGWSDSINTKFGKRMPFILVGGALILITISLMPFSINNIVFLAIELVVFFIGFYTYYAAYYAFYPDFVPKDESGRSQGVVGSFRALGMLLVLGGGGFMLAFWIPLPFLMVNVILIIVTTILYIGIRKKITTSENKKEKMEINWLAEWNILRDSRRIMLWFIANTFWESAIAVLKVFIVLYFTRGLDFTLTETSIALSLVGIAAVIGAPFAGKLADKYGHKPVILYSALFFAIGLLIPMFTRQTYFIAGILPVAFAAIILITLPYSLLMTFLPKHQYHGAGAALFVFSQGIGALIGPFVGGVAVELLKHSHFLFFEKTHGYVTIFLIASIFLFTSIPFANLIFKER